MNVVELKKLGRVLNSLTTTTDLCFLEGKVMVAMKKLNSPFKVRREVNFSIVETASMHYWLYVWNNKFGLAVLMDRTDDTETELGQDLDLDFNILSEIGFPFKEEEEEKYECEWKEYQIPWLFPAFENLEKRIKEILGEEWEWSNSSLVRIFLRQPKMYGYHYGREIKKIKTVGRIKRKPTVEKGKLRIYNSCCLEREEWLAIPQWRGGEKFYGYVLGDLGDERKGYAEVVALENEEGNNVAVIKVADYNNIKIKRGEEEIILDGGVWLVTHPLLS